MGIVLFSKIKGRSRIGSTKVCVVQATKGNRKNNGV